MTHGVFVNDVHLNHDAVSVADAYKGSGYDTAYIGKWHVDGRGRSNFIPREGRQGFDYWKVLECTHNYNNSFYYADENFKLVGMIRRRSANPGRAKLYSRAASER